MSRFNPSKRKQSTICIERIEVKEETMRDSKGKKIGERVHLCFYLKDSKSETYHCYFDTIDATDKMKIAKIEFKRLKEFMEDIDNLA